MKEIKTVGIVGFGVMGAAIGLNAAAAGYKVVFKELNDELVATMYEKWVVKALDKRVAKGKITQADMDGLTSMIEGTSSYDDLAVCDLVIEAAIETGGSTIRMSGNGDMSIEATQKLELKAPQVEIKGDIGVKINGTTVELN